MPPYGEPDWATPGETSTTQQVTGTSGVAGSNGASTTNVNTGEARARARWIIGLLSLFNMGIAAMMGALGILSLMSYVPDAATLTSAFLGAYMVIFACILFSYEIIWWQPFAGLNKIFRRNFGFMYGLKGKGMFLLFIAFLCLGLKDSSLQSGVHGLDWATFAAWLADGVFHIFISIAWYETNDAYKPPTVGLITKEEVDNGTGTPEETPNAV